jgi:hypothetical protein
LTFDSFFDRVGDLDWLAVVVGAIVFMVIGWIWYGPLFGKQWSAGTGMPMDSGMPSTDKIISTFVYSFVLSAAVNYFGALDDFEHAVVSALLLGIFVIGAATYSQVVWERRKTNVWVIDTLYVFVAIAIVNYVQGLMA